MRTHKHKQIQTNVTPDWSEVRQLSVIVTLVPMAADGAAESSSGALEAWLSVGDGVGVPAGEESMPQICSSSSPAVDDE